MLVNVFMSIFISSLFTKIDSFLHIILLHFKGKNTIVYSAHQCQIRFPVSPPNPTQPPCCLLAVPWLSPVSPAPPNPVLLVKAGLAFPLPSWAFPKASPRRSPTKWQTEVSRYDIMVITQGWLNPHLSNAQWACWPQHLPVRQTSGSNMALCCLECGVRGRPKISRKSTGLGGGWQFLLTLRTSPYCMWRRCTRSKQKDEADFGFTSKEGDTT